MIINDKERLARNDVVEPLSLMKYLNYLEEMVDATVGSQRRC